MTIRAAGLALPVEGRTEVALPVERLWDGFADAESWPAWNPCFARVWVRGGRLHEGSRFVWLFNPIRPWYLYRLPAVARITEWRPRERVTWEVRVPGFHALHSYSFEALGPGRSRFGSSEVAEGPAYERLRRFWLAHFRYVCRASLDGAVALARRGVGVQLQAFGEARGRPPLLAVPGLDGSIGSIEPLVKRLAAHRRVLVADYTAEHNPTLEDLAAEIAAVARAQVGGEVDLLGQSIGTLMAAEIAAGGALPVRRVVLIGTFTRVRDATLRVANALSAISPDALQRLTAPALMAVACGPVGDGRRHPFFPAARRSIFSRTRRRTAWQVARDFSPLLRRIDRPLLVVLGECDRFPRSGDAARVREAVEPRGRVVSVPDAGHVLLPSQVIEFAAREIGGFLA
jgi:pimeloyl-ACP methyl ester carboxylesterase